MKAKTILPAKITRPSVSNIYLRKRLFQRLDTERKNKGIYVCGPPGAGKTTLINSWIESRRLPCLWYRVEKKRKGVRLALLHYFNSENEGQVLLFNEMLKRVQHDREKWDRLLF